MKILAIETSCDETAASVVETDGSSVKILSNVIASQIKIHQKYGGVFPELASRAHAEKIIPVVEEALISSKKCEIRNEKIGKKQNSLSLISSDFNLIAVTTGPGLIGSLLVGVNFAKTYAYVNNLPIIGVNHLLGHIYSNFISHPELSGEGPLGLSENRHPSEILHCVQNDLPQFPALILIVSGGHTGLVLMKSHNEIIPLGETLDDAAGEAFDKVAKLLDLGYPGGPAISTEVEKYQKDSCSIVIPAKAGIQSNLDSKSCRRPVWNDNINFPRSMLNRPDYNFSFSGLKTAVLYKVKEITQDSSLKTQDYSAAIAAEFQQTVIDILVGKTIQAAYEFKPKSICLCGGVSANKELREQMKKKVSMLPWKVSYHIPPLILSTDNAAMIGMAAAYHLDQKTTWDKIHANANLRL